MSIVRVGLGENQKFADGYEAIFGKKKSAQNEPTPEPAKPKAAQAKKTPAKKKK